jgi:hypothetical protein
LIRITSRELGFDTQSFPVRVLHQFAADIEADAAALEESLKK